MNRFILVLVFFVLPIAPSNASEEGIIVRTAQVYEEASRSSRQLEKLNAGTPVSVFSRKGGWKEIFSEDKSMVGWVRAYQVREGKFARRVEAEKAADQPTDQRGFLAGLASFSRKASRFFSTGGSSTSSGTATIGVRGLSEAQLKSAKPDFEQFEIMQQYNSNNSRLDKFVRDGRLQANDVKHIASKKKSAGMKDKGKRDK